MAWLRLFRIVNLPTVPGDAIAGASVAAAVAGNVPDGFVAKVLASSAASVFLYMFGLVDNDIVGSSSDRGRPIADGEIGITAARSARAGCLAAALAIAWYAALDPLWWAIAALLTAAITAYNRFKRPWIMGTCRALNVFCGVAACQFQSAAPALASLPVAVAWFGYITWITHLSAGEESDDSLRRRIGFFIGAIVYLQLAVAVVFPVTPFLLALAAMLVSLRALKFLFPKVSAS